MRTIETTPAFDRKRRTLLLGAIALAVAAPERPASAQTGSSGADATQVELRREQESILVTATARVGADRATTWGTLADYDRLAEFVPGMLASRTVSRDGSNAVVEQRGVARFGPFKREFALRFEVEEEPLATIRSRAVAGDFRRFEAMYRIAEAGGGTAIDYSARLEPVDGVPPLVGLMVMRGEVRRQFEALVAEIGRRAAA